MRILALLALTGCSAILMDRPREIDLTVTQVNCTTSRSYVVADLVIGSSLILVGSLLMRSFLKDQGQSKARDEKGMAGYVMMPLGLTYEISAAMGLYWTGECRDQVDEINSR